MEKLRLTSQSVCSEMWTISSRMAYLSAFRSTGRLLYTLHIKPPPPPKKNQVLLDLAKEEAIAHHRNEKSPAAWTSTILLRTQVKVAGNLRARDSLIISYKIAM